jgi:hypothetical protein
VTDFANFASPLSAERVLVRNATAGSVARVMVTGWWAEPGEASRGFVPGREAVPWRA